MKTGRSAFRVLLCAGLAMLAGSPALAAPDDVRLPRPRPNAEAAALSPPPADAAEPVVTPEGTPVASLEGETPRLPRPRPEEPAVAPGEVETAALPAAMPDVLPESVLQAGGKAIVTLPLPEAQVGPWDTVGATDELARLPQPRPEPSARLALLEPGTAEEMATPPPRPVAVTADETACLGRLETLGVAFVRRDAIGSGACNVALPLEVTSAGSGVGIAPAATMNCRSTEALALWVRDSLVPTARRDLSATPTRIMPGSTYACRPRNNQRGAKLSEHARANAFDVMGVAFAERVPIEVGFKSLATAEGRFQASIRRDGCRYFTTVLGPGSDASHANHLHFDLAERRGGYRLCSLGAPSEVARAPEKTKRE